MKYFKHVTHFDCIYCHREFAITDPTFKTMNKHGWGCCADCWEMDLPNATAINTTYMPPNVLAAIHNNKAPQITDEIIKRQISLKKYENNWRKELVQ